MDEDEHHRLRYELLTRILDSQKDPIPEIEFMSIPSLLLHDLCSSASDPWQQARLFSGTTKRRSERFEEWLGSDQMDAWLRSDSDGGELLRQADATLAAIGTDAGATGIMCDPDVWDSVTFEDVLNLVPDVVGPLVPPGTPKSVKQSVAASKARNLFREAEYQALDELCKRIIAMNDDDGPSTSGREGRPTTVPPMFPSNPPVQPVTSVNVGPTRGYGPIVDLLGAPPPAPVAGVAPLTGFATARNASFVTADMRAPHTTTHYPDERTPEPDLPIAGFKRGRDGFPVDSVPEAPSAASSFVSGKQQFRIDSAKAGRRMDAGAPAPGGYQPAKSIMDACDSAGGPFGAAPQYSFNASDKSRKGGAGLRRFKPPTKIGEEGATTGSTSGTARAADGSGAPVATASKSKILEEYGENLPEVLKNCEPRLIEMIENEIMDCGEPVTFDDIAGLYDAKAVMVEAVVWPMQMPELFKGLTRQPKGVLLFGPPGTGKTLIGKAVAHECGATFFAISASSLTSKWIGESEKLVRTLFAVAALKQPSIIFMDEIDSLLTARGDGEHESSRRVKTEFLVQLDGAATRTSDFVLVIGATNRPQELDEAARRRFTKRIYVPLPDAVSRRALVNSLLRKEKHELSAEDVERVVAQSEGYSGADVNQLCREAAMGALRIGLTRHVVRVGGAFGGGVGELTKRDLPAITIDLFQQAFETVKPSVATSELTHYIKWNSEFGSEASKSALQTLAIMRPKPVKGGVDDGSDGST